MIALMYQRARRQAVCRGGLPATCNNSGAGPAAFCTSYNGLYGHAQDSSLVGPATLQAVEILTSR